VTSAEVLFDITTSGELEMKEPLEQGVSENMYSLCETFPGVSNSFIRWSEMTPGIFYPVLRSFGSV
jgi:hypothetical protein